MQILKGANTYRSLKVAALVDLPLDSAAGHIACMRAAEALRRY